MEIGRDDYLTPVMYQDLASACMQPMPMIGIGPCGGYPTNLTGGSKIPKQLDNDKFERMQEKEKKDMGFLKKAGIAILVLGGLGFVKFKPIRKWISSKATQVADWCKNLFKKTPATPTPTGTPTP